MTTTVTITKERKTINNLTYECAISQLAEEIYTAYCRQKEVTPTVTAEIKTSNAYYAIAKIDTINAREIVVLGVTGKERIPIASVISIAFYTL